MIRIFISACLCFITAPALAQNETEWRVTGPADWQGRIAMASICPLLDREVTGNFFCISLGCSATSPLSWRIDFAGAGVVPAQLRTQFSVDALGLSSIPMVQDDGNLFGYSAPYDATRDATTLARFAAGQTGLVDFDTTQLNAFSFSLAGADVALNTALTTCVAAGAGPGAPAPIDPRAQVLGELTESCSNIGAPGPLQEDPGFETRADVTGDGTEDVIFNYGAVRCASGASVGYCGSGGCSHAIWAGQADGSFREVFRDTVYALQIEWRPILTTQTHGITCGLTGAEGPCTNQYAIAPDGTISPAD